MNFYKLLSTFVGHFCPPGSGSGFQIRIRIRIHRPDWIRIHNPAKNIRIRIRIANTAELKHWGFGSGSGLDPDSTTSVPQHWCKDYMLGRMSPEPVLLNCYGAPELIPRNEFRQPCSLAGRYDNPIPLRFLAPIDCLKIPALPPCTQSTCTYGSWSRSATLVERIHVKLCPASLFTQSTCTYGSWSRSATLV